MHAHESSFTGSALSQKTFRHRAVRSIGSFNPPDPWILLVLVLRAASAADAGTGGWECAAAWQGSRQCCHPRKVGLYPPAASVPAEINNLRRKTEGRTNVRR